MGRLCSPHPTPCRARGVISLLVPEWGRQRQGAQTLSLEGGSRACRGGCSSMPPTSGQTPHKSALPSLSTSPSLPAPSRDPSSPRLSLIVLKGRTPRLCGIHLLFPFPHSLLKNEMPRKSFL